jgi:hypothetical protein
MADDRDPLAAFDSEVIAAAAREHGLETGDLADLLARHQEGVRELPGVEDIVYEWRTQFHRDPLAGRTPGAYYLALPAHVWDEFLDALGVEGDRADALRAAHRVQFDRAAEEAGFDPDRAADDAAVVLTRP